MVRKKHMKNLFKLRGPLKLSWSLPLCQLCPIPLWACNSRPLHMPGARLAQHSEWVQSQQAALPGGEREAGQQGLTWDLRPSSNCLQGHLSGCPHWPSI